MKHLIYLFFFLLIAMAQAQMTIAITEFRNQSGEFHLDSWEKSIESYLKTNLSGSEQLIVVERENLGAVLKEQSLGQTGVIDPATAQEIGGLLGARYVITGTIIKNDDQIIVSAQIIQVSSGQLRSEQVSAPDDKHFNEMMQLLANNILFNLVGEPEYRRELKLKPYPTGYFLGASVLFAAGTVIVNNAYHKDLDAYGAAENLADFDDRYDSANQLFKMRNALAVLTGVGICGTLYCWIQNQSAGAITAGEKPAGVMIIPSISSDLRSVYAGVTLRF